MHQAPRMKRPVSPLKVALIAFGLACAVLAVVFATIPAPEPSGWQTTSDFDRWREAGHAMGTAGFGVGVIAYVVQRWRLKRFDETNQ